MLEITDGQQMLTVNQVAEALRLSQGTVYAWVRSGRLPALRMGRIVRIPRKALEERLEAWKTA